MVQLHNVVKVYTQMTMRMDMDTTACILFYDFPSIPNHQQLLWFQCKLSKRQIKEGGY